MAFYKQIEWQNKKTSRATVIDRRVDKFVAKVLKDKKKVIQNKTKNCFI